MNQILQGPVTPEVLVITNLLHFILFFVIDQEKLGPYVVVSQ